MRSLVTGIIWGFAAIGVVSSFVYVYAVYVDRKIDMSQHTSTVSGSSGDLKCTTSCVIKEQ
jgi:4-hydroxybenzoate polyprenyltransferase